MPRLKRVVVRQNPQGSGFALDGQPFGDSTVDVLLGTDIDSEWIVRKFRMNFNPDDFRKLKRAVYSIGQGGRRWFSGGREISAREASTILDYTVLIELLIEHRGDMHPFRDELIDLREQLRMQISRSTDGQSDRVESLVAEVVGRIADHTGIIAPD